MALVDREFAAGFAGLAADVEAQVVLEDVEEGDEDRQLRDQGDAGGKGVDFVLLVEAHHFLLHALFVVFVFLLDLLDLRLQGLQRAHPFQLFVGQRDQQRPDADRQGDDRAAPGEADRVVEEDEDLVGDVDQELRGELESERQHQAFTSPWYSAGSTGPTAQREAVRDRVEAAVAEGVAAQQAPGGEQEAADDAEALDRLDRVGRAGRLVAAAPGSRRGDPALVGARSGPGRSVSRGTPPGERLFAGSAVDAGGALALDQVADLGAGDDDEVVALGQAVGEAPERLAQGPLDACCARPRRRPCGSPRRRASRPHAPRHGGERCRGRGSGWHGMNRRDRRGRTRRCARGAVASTPSTG